MSCVDFMYQFYSPYFSYKSPADDVQKFPSQQLYEAGLSAPPVNGFLDNHHGGGPHVAGSGGGVDKDAREPDSNKSTAPHPHPHPHPHSQPRATHYLASNCVLFTYFSGEAATVVDEHFSRALSQPSSYTLDKPAPSNKPYNRSESLLMCHRKLPPSFWNSAYQPPYHNSNSNNNGSSSSSSGGGGGNFSLGADAYLQSSLYNFHKAWPYHYGSQSHTYPHPQSSSHGLPYPGMTSHYGSFVMPGTSLTSRVADSRHAPQYDFSKGSEAFSNYYGMGRFGPEVESTLPGLDLPLQQTKKEHYW